MKYKRLQKLLDEEYTFPTTYTFKFIVNPESKNDVLAAVDGGTLIKTNESRNGKYVSLTISKKVNSSSTIIEVYKRVSRLKGIISL